MDEGVSIRAIARPPWVAQSLAGGNQTKRQLAATLDWGYHGNGRMSLIKPLQRETTFWNKGNENSLYLHRAEQVIPTVWKWHTGNQTFV